MLSVVTIVVHEILHNQWIEYSHEDCSVYAIEIACAHVIFSVGDSLEALCSGGRKSSGGDLNL